MAAMPNPPSRIGQVLLVGAGPGDPGLITLKGQQALAQAEVVLYDGLVDDRLLDHCPAGARVVYVGKREGTDTFPQAEINQRLIDEARAGHRVVRLKGGDPFIFGRGGEEAQALTEAGIPFEVVPGISAGVGAPAYAGIPLTHRAFSSELTFLTGRECAAGTGVPVDWAKHAPGASTLVIYMGRDRLPDLVRLLIDHGRDPGCPVAVIFAGTTDRQHTIVAPLGEIAERAAGVRPGEPALIVVGDVVRLREDVRWFEERGQEA
jgi:uroporphyrinogen III methyltransferase/synthase